MTTIAEDYGLTEDQLEQLSKEVVAIRERVMAEVGQEDVDYIRRVIRWQRGLEVTGRAALFLSSMPPMWLLGTAALSVSKILDNMEIGHNVMHGQYDWTGDPALSSSAFEWDCACPSDQWRRTHNFRHHTFSNIVGKDRDLGYATLRITDKEPWTPKALGNPIAAFLLCLIFEYGVMLHDSAFDEVAAGKKDLEEAKASMRVGLRKGGRAALKDYVLWPALTGPSFVPTLTANLTANLVRNLWASMIIFCGHFPAGVAEFSMEECEDESKGHWYFRQMLGAANIKGGRLFHLMTGNLSFQIEHHLYPDMPARRYRHIADDIQALCERYGLPYATGRLSKQFGSVIGKIFRYALPDRENGTGSGGDGARAGKERDPALAA